MMRIYAYIRILGDEATIHRFSQQANVPDAVVKQLKARRVGDGNQLLWNWATPPVFIDVADVDGGLKALLSAYRGIFPLFQKYRASKTDIYLEIVSQYEKNEKPQGLYLSPETIGLVCELGGAIDNDVERLMEAPRSPPL
jgi:hypothetical protein